MLTTLTRITDSGHTRLTITASASTIGIVSAAQSSGSVAQSTLRNAMNSNSSVSGNTRNSAARVSSLLSRRMSAFTAASPVQRNTIVG